MEFDDWMTEVDSAVYRLVGVSCYDLPDFDYWSAYEDDQAPREVAKNAVDYGFDS